MSDIGIFDYGVGNLRSIANAIETIGATPVVSRSHDTLLACDRCILPGVGAFIYAMNALREYRLDATFNACRAADKPILGICLGMQLFGTSSTEFGQAQGLGAIDASADRLDAAQPGSIRLPHVGWASVKAIDQRQSLARHLAMQIAPSEQFYFIHSYAMPACGAAVAGISRYCDIEFAAIIGEGNLVGTQFHPERSGQAGLRFLASFCQSSGEYDNDE